MTETLLVVDGNSIACRGAFVKPTLTNSKGRETGGSFRFFSMLDKAMRMVRATHVVVSWDVGGQTFRNVIDETYKANRLPKGDSLYHQFDDIKLILDAVGIKHVGIQGYEGDDIVGTYASVIGPDKIYVFSGDKDNFQLIDDNVRVLYPLTGSEMRTVDREYFEKSYGIKVEQFVDMKTLMGDGGDNVKGIEKCGEKTAAKWLNTYGDLENIILNAGDIKGKIGENLRSWIPDAYKTRDLVRIDRTVEVPYKYEDLKIDLKWEEAEPIFRELEFFSYIKKAKQGGFYNVSTW
ncbi:gp690 [Bacillus phage G]|uniref:Gp690 n=1 Tax=Bacillus phage G TaxID=2884420 RepID=G3MB70_9CAUD|nr:gp690 [Bacillus phage G]AEO93933.1 gp690 [Bacillus phage G]